MAKKASGSGARDASERSDRDLAAALMRHQAALSIKVAAVFLVVVLGVPLVNQFLPELSQTPILGFPASWFLLGLLFYPLTWGLSTYFVKASEKLEAEEASMVRSERSGVARK